jgi:hypothetical protein
LLYAVTPWSNVDLITSNLELFDVEYELTAAWADGHSVLAARLREMKQAFGPALVIGANSGERRNQSQPLRARSESC